MHKEIIHALDRNPFHRYIYQMAHEEDIQTVLEIGSADGTGSTHILSQALAEKAQRVQVYCLETNSEKCELLKSRFSDQKNFNCFNNYSVYPAEYPEESDVIAFYRGHESALRRYPMDKVLEWLRSEQKNYATTARQVDGIQAIIHETGLKYFDLVILDGSEFTGPADLDAVYGAGIIILDDINSYKNYANYQRLSRDRAYYLIQENWYVSHGSAVFKRKKPLKTGLSAVIHSHNSEDKLPQCLESLRWVDECLVIDMYSSDRTVQIAREFGARVLHHVPVTCVDEARNFGLAQVGYAWTLVVDSDEVIPEALAHALKDCMAQNPEPDAFWLPRKNIFFGSWVASLYPDYQMRFFRSQQVLWRGIVHEHPLCLGQAAWFQAEPDESIVHYSYDTVFEFVERQENYSKILWKQYQTFLPSKDQFQAFKLRKNFEKQSHNLSDYFDRTQPDNHEWLVKNLYLCAELLNTGYVLEQTGQLQGLNTQDHPKISVYTYLKNGEKFDYPFLESILSVIEVCDECIVCCASDSEDQTWLYLQRLEKMFPKIRLLPSELWKEKNLVDGAVIRLAAEEAMSYCTGDWLWHLQADEVYTRADARTLRELVNTYHRQAVDGFIFNVLHFYAGYDQQITAQAAEIGWYQKCIRLIRAGAGHHIGDAWTIVMSDLKPSTAIPVDVTIYHYGHVRDKEAMRTKATYMETLYHALPDTYEFCPEGKFEYSQVPQKYLKPFLTPHPETMQLRIAKSTLKNVFSGQLNKPRLLVVSRYPGVKKGYGITFSELYQTELLQQYFEIHHLAWQYYEQEQQINGVHFYPDNQDLHQHPEVLRELLYQVNPDVILLHADPHFFLPYLKELQAWKGPVMAWFTIDYEREHNPDALLPLFQRCQRIAGMADFGIKQIQKDFSGPVAKVPLGVNSALFRPPGAAQKQTIRDKQGVPEGAFVFLTVANNFWRKGLEYTIRGIAEFKHKYPQAASQSIFHFHTESSPNLLELIANYQLESHIRFTPHYDPYKNPLDVKDLVALYQMSDAFLLSTLGEGFGMPILEAQACGLPVIVSDNSVLREISGNFATYIRCPALLCGQNAGRVVWMRAPDVEQMAEHMFHIYSGLELRHDQAEKGLHHARENSWTKTVTLLGAELAKSLGTGTLEYVPPEPGIQKV